MKRKFSSILLAVMLCPLCAAPAHAQEYTFNAPDSFLFGRPASDSTIYKWEDSNVDRSKDAALIPPAFGTDAGSQSGSGGQFTPSLPATVTDGNAAAIALPAGTVTDSGAPSGKMKFTQVTGDLYYSDGSLGMLKIPAIGLTVRVFEGTDSAALLKGAGHFTGASIWDGNCCIAAHNRGVRNDFGKLHTLRTGDTVTLTTKLGTRTYFVTSVTRVLETDTSGLSVTAENCVTLYTCVNGQPAYRWCVRAQMSAGNPA